jgi:hypothetical protein
MKFRDMGIPPEEFDAIIVHYLSQRKSGAEIQSGTATENNPSEKSEGKEDLKNDDLE